MAERVIELRATQPGWALDGLPSEVLAVRFQWQVELHFGGPERWCVLQLEGPFTVEAADGSTVLADPGGDPASLASVLPVLRRRLLTLEVDSGDTLTATFDGGRVITCQPQMDFEAWSLSAGAGGFFLAAAPGAGGVAAIT